MSKPSTNRVNVERWNISVPKSDSFKSGRAVVTKVATRNHLGQFHGATNFKGTLLRDK